ncbi:MAG TPA: aminotransferase class I/II-fold pyridoxal phosphate-dependent enzyme [Gemmatimonadaceae bacterium]|jgi:glycine C-acetyltransferase
MDTQVEAETITDVADYDYSSFYYSSSQDPFAILEPFDDWYSRARLRGYYLYGQPMSTAPETHVDIEDQLTHQHLDLLNFASYNYLGLSHRPEVIAAGKCALDKYGLGAAGSPILSGMMQIHEELEGEVARFKRKEAAIVFPTGYSTNIGLIQGLMRPGDLVVADQNAHASIVDGAILSKANLRFFKHNKPEDLDKKLAGTTGKKLVVIEGVYSMDGDVCKLPEIVEITKRHGARLVIDEAHSMFVYGESGRGVVEQFGLEDEVDIHVGTFSKALGGQGGYVAGSRQLYNYLKGFARSRFFSCALSPVVAAGVLQSLKIVQQEPQLRKRLWENVTYMRGALARYAIDIGDSTSQVIPVMIRNDRRIMHIASRLQEAGLYLQPIIYPAVAKHRSRFRMSISAAHTREDLDQAVSILVRVLRQERIL